MNNGNSYTTIDNIRKKWVWNQLFRYILLALAAALLLSLPGITIGILAFVTVLVALLLWNRPWRLQNEEVARYLDQTFPQLEDSAALLLKSPDQLNLLETLQVQKITPVLQGVQLPRSFYRPLRQAAWITAGALVVTLLAVFALTRIKIPGSEILSGTAIPARPATILPGITSARITIIPPAYTRRASRTQPGFNITAEDSATVQWELHTNNKVKQLQLLFNDSTRLPLKPGKDSTTWTATRILRKPGFYQVSLNGALSELYQLQLQPDQLPVIRIAAPKPYTTIEFGQSARVNVQATLTDDYGIRNAAIALTIASGSGEAVRFRELQQAFNTSFNAQATAYQVNKLLDLTALGLKPGDELYFHITATDTRRQQTRSDVYIITLPDTAQLFSMDGLINGVNFKPEYFRSQRQIILDAEQLLREKDSLGTVKFNSRSNDLGTDQKLLRLRYGKFLGEESESNVGDPRVAAEEGHDDHHDHDTHETADPKDFGNAAKVLDEFTDKHDNAEDATFFDPEVKKQLRATLTEMWKAELQLRLYKPREALPFAYKALRLLKDLQQQSRVFVAKTGVKTTPLKPEKRLTGEQDKIQPAVKKETTQTKDELGVIRVALSVLEGIKAGEAPGNITSLQEASQLLATQAAAAPAVYLPALEAMRRITQHKNTGKDLLTAQKGLQKMLAAPALLPQPAKGAVDISLPQRYFRNLKTGTP